jgi:hypothetical protein
VLAITSAFRCAVKRDRDSHAHRTAGASSSRSGSAGREGSSLCTGFRISASGLRYLRWIDRTRCAGETGAAAPPPPRLRRTAEARRVGGRRLPATEAACSERLVRRVIPRSGSQLRIADASRRFGCQPAKGPCRHVTETGGAPRQTCRPVLRPTRMRAESTNARHALAR